MTMTYAAQVRSMSKSLSKQTVQSDIYDINSLNIICQYFVGSIVIVKTVDEIIEGVMHTISNNKICLTLVTIAKLSNPACFTKILSSKLISLSDVLSISAQDADNVDVTVKGKYIRESPKAVTAHSVTNGRKTIPKLVINKCPKNKVQLEQSVTVAVSDKEPARTNGDVAQDTPKQNGKGITDKKSDSGDSKKCNLNPNAAEFRPRPPLASYSDSVAEPVLFSPQMQPFPQVFTPNSAPAIFVPNLYFYAPNHLSTVEGVGVDHISMSPTVGVDRYASGPDFHVQNGGGLPFAPVMPMFQHTVPIFIPHNSYRPNRGPGCSSESSNVPEVVSAASDSVNIELSNPSNWPPLPNPATATNGAAETETAKKI